MKPYKKDVEIRWSDIDANAHLRHSVYYDWGSFCRISFLNDCGMTVKRMQDLAVGPVLFREECTFRKEVHLGDKITVTLELLKARKDFSRWSIKHQVIKNDAVMAAVIVVEGAWFNTTSRKLVAPPVEAVEAYAAMPQAADFQWLD